MFKFPASQISTKICIKLFTKAIWHLVEKLSLDIDGLAWYSFWKHYSPKSRYVFANSSSCQYDALEVSFQEKLDGLFWSAVVSRASRFLLFTPWSHHWWFWCLQFSAVNRSTAVLRTFTQYIHNNKMNQPAVNRVLNREWRLIASTNSTVRALEQIVRGLEQIVRTFGQIISALEQIVRAFGQN